MRASPPSTRWCEVKKTDSTGGPLASIVPIEVVAAALVIVGVMMMSQLRHIDISEFSVAFRSYSPWRPCRFPTRSPTASASADP
jgi:hypothetical protein